MYFIPTGLFPSKGTIQKGMKVVTEAIQAQFDMRVDKSGEYIHVDLSEALKLCIYQVIQHLKSKGIYIGHVTIFNKSGLQLPRNCSIKISWDGRVRMHRPTIIFTISLVAIDGALNSHKYTLPICLMKGRESQSLIDRLIVDLRYVMVYL